MLRIVVALNVTRGRVCPRGAYACGCCVDLICDDRHHIGAPQAASDSRDSSYLSLSIAFYMHNTRLMGCAGAKNVENALISASK